MPEERKKRIYRFEEFQLDADERLLLRGGAERVELSPRNFALLLKLVENAGHLLEKETLLGEVWAGAVVEEGNLNRTISNLRKALGEKPNENRFIETVPRVGYRFVAPVTALAESNGEIRKAEPGGRAEDQPPESDFRRPPRRARGGRAWPILLASLLFAAAAVGFLAWRGARDAAKLRPNGAAFDEPLRLTDDPNDDSHPRWTSDGRIRFFRIDAGRRTESLIMNADGTDQTPVRDFNNLKYGVWSPDGRKVIFARPDDKAAYYLANSDGSDQIALPFYAGNFDWSPDSKQIVYQKTVEPNNPDIFVYSAETGAIRNVTNAPSFDADPSFSPDGKKIVFVSSRHENKEIYLMNADGSDVRRLTEHPADDSHPVFSPDGTQIAFTSDRENENADVYLMGAGGGSGARKLTDWKTNETVEPGCWSPDGTRIAFFSDRNGKDDIYVTSAEVFRPQAVLSDDGRNLGFASYSPDGGRIVYQAEAEDRSGELRVFDLKTKQSSLLLKGEYADFSPAFSPDGEWVAFQNLVGGNTDIFLIRPDGSGLKNLTQNPAKDVSPAFSPDGRQIVFTSNRNGQTQVLQIYLMNAADGSDQRRIYYSNAFSASPSWSPDGREIAFANDKEDHRTGNFEIFIIEPENAEAERRLTFRRGYDILPAFSPGGERVAFVSRADGNSEIYVMDRAGGSLLRLTRNAAEDLAPHWSPDGRRIIFSSNRGGKSALYEILLPDN